MDTTRDSAWLNEHLLHQLRSECVGFNQMKERKIPQVNSWKPSVVRNDGVGHLLRLGVRRGPCGVSLRPSVCR